MLRTDAPPRRRAPRMRDAVVSLRSPLPLLVAGLGAALLVIALVTLPQRPPPTTQTENLSPQEVRSIVAHEMRSADAAAQIVNRSEVQFDDGTWRVSIGEAQFHFTQRNRIVVADNDAAVQFQYRGPPQ
jgi:hypothetical protein